MVMLPAHAWKQRSVVDGATIALHTPPGSPHVMMRSEVHINMAPERCFAFYLVRSQPGRQLDCCIVC
jgi:hypothetical protein